MFASELTSGPITRQYSLSLTAVNGIAKFVISVGYVGLGSVLKYCAVQYCCDDVALVNLITPKRPSFPVGKLNDCPDNIRFLTGPSTNEVFLTPTTA